MVQFCTTSPSSSPVIGKFHDRSSTMNRRFLFTINELDAASKFNMADEFNGANEFNEGQRIQRGPAARRSPGAR